MKKCVFTCLLGDMCSSHQKPAYRSPASPTLLTWLCTKQCKTVCTWISSPKYRLRNVVTNGDMVGITAYVEVCCGRDSFEHSIKALWKSPENILNIINCINAFANKNIGTWIFYQVSHYIILPSFRLLWLQVELSWWTMEVHPNSTDICWGFICSKDMSLSFSYCLRSKLPWRKPQNPTSSRKVCICESEALNVGSHGKILYFPTLSYVQHIGHISVAAMLLTCVLCY